MDKDLLKKIQKECFWEYSFDGQAILDMASGKDQRETQFLFDKILENSSEVIGAVRVFPEKELIRLIKKKRVPKFNQSLCSQKLKILVFHYLKKPVVIPELDWQIK